jgi:hypothetical protein
MTLNRTAFSYCKPSTLRVLECPRNSSIQNMKAGKYATKKYTRFESLAANAKRAAMRVEGIDSTPSD